jgi:2-polyprenyl-3-methyl-5-hydroxy-6-metoxy-1,4-benzoquinol methylase
MQPSDDSTAMQAARASRDDLAARRADLLRRIQCNRDEREALLREALVAKGMSESDADRFILKGMPQSSLFMVEIIPFLHRHYLHLPENAEKSVLDVGPQNFAGTALLANLHTRTSFNRLKLSVSAIDIVDSFAMLKEIVAPSIKFVVGNVYNLPAASYDTVIASHVVEHVPDPLGFMNKLQSIARDFAIIATPWRESPLSSSHINVIDEDLLRQAGGEDVQIFTNYSWGKGRKVCMFKLPGLAISSTS